MRHGSLFSGIGGFDLAAEWMGWENVFHCEWNEFGQKVLKYYWPEAESFDDITKTDFTKYHGTIDIISGGFPCQPYSSAGKRKGKDDDRHLWPEMLRAIREISPRYVVGENVRGLTNWNGGLVFDEVCAELEAIGYQVAPVIIPACGVNAPHRRERIWFVAYSNLFRSIANIERKERFQRGSRGKALSKFNGASSKEIITNASSDGLQDALENRKLERGRFRIGNKSHIWDAFPSKSPICSGNDGLPYRLDGITFSKWRNESIKAYGNAIVPQVAYEIFKAIIKTAHGDGLLQ
jgi:DNA (cytosine-5)-methyltransferase 1